MAIQSGTHLGPYEILSAIGAGGMGEVYRDRAPNFGRDVGIKVLPETFAGDASRIARFQRAPPLLLIDARQGCLKQIVARNQQLQPGKETVRWQRIWRSTQRIFMRHSMRAI